MFDKELWRNNTSHFPYKTAWDSHCETREKRRNFHLFYGGIKLVVFGSS